MGGWVVASAWTDSYSRTSLAFTSAPVTSWSMASAGKRSGAAGTASTAGAAAFGAGGAAAKERMEGEDEEEEERGKRTMSKAPAPIRPAAHLKEAESPWRPPP